MGNQDEDERRSWVEGDFSGDALAPGMELFLNST